MNTYCDVTIGFPGNEHTEKAEFVAWLGWNASPEFAYVKFYDDGTDSRAHVATVHASRVHNIRKENV